MSHPLRNALKNGFWNAICTGLLSFSLCLLWSRVLTGEGRTLSLLLKCALGAFLLSAVDQGFPGKWKILVFSILILGEGVLAYFGRGQLYSIIQAIKTVPLQPLFDQPVSSVYHDHLRTALVLLYTVLQFPMVRDDSSGAGIFVFAVSAFSCFVLRQVDSLPLYSFPLEEGVRMLLPGIAGCFLLLSAASRRKWSALPVAVLLTALAYFLLPSAAVRNQELNEALHSLADYRGEFLSITDLEKRESFSLTEAGYQPQQDRLGGSASLSDEQVLRVRGDSSTRIYLRARAYDRYTSFNWVNTLPGSGALFSGISSDDRRDLLFPYADSAAAGHSLQVTFLKEDTTTVFAPLRLGSFTGLENRMVLYYAPSTELYITRNLAAGDSYRLSWYPEELVPVEDEEAWEWACAHYLSVTNLQSEIQELVSSVTDGLTDPYERADAIRLWLSSHFRYSLQVETPPENVDFVSYFLLSQKEGYCTYFASAMTVLCRMAGVPARYVVGYAFNTDDEGIAVVTTDQAHAWTEVYIRNYGWVTMDATPGQGGTGSVPSPASSRNPGRTPTPLPSVSPGRSPSVSPSAAPAVSPGKDASSTPSPVPEEALRSLSPSPGVSSSPSDPPGSKQDSPELSEGFPVLLLVAALLLLVLLLFVYRIRSRVPERLVLRFPDRAASIRYAAALELLSLMRSGKRRAETWNEYGRRLSSLPGLSDAPAACADMARAFYARDPVLSDAVAEPFLAAVRRAAGRKNRAIASVRRAFRSRGRCFFP